MKKKKRRELKKKKKRNKNSEFDRITAKQFNCFVHFNKGYKHSQQHQCYWMTLPVAISTEFELLDLSDLQGRLQ